MMKTYLEKNNAVQDDEFGYSELLKQIPVVLDLGILLTLQYS